MKKELGKVLIFIGILTLVTSMWQELELLESGRITPNNVDTIVGLILTCSLYFNFKNWRN